MFTHLTDNYANNANKFPRVKWKFQIIQHLGCSEDTVQNNNWTSIKVLNRTDYEIIDVVPYTQYGVQVLIDGEHVNATIQKENTVYIVTPASSKNRQTRWK